MTTYRGHRLWLARDGALVWCYALDPDDPQEVRIGVGRATGEKAAERVRAILDEGWNADDTDSVLSVWTAPPPPSPLPP